jgi:hypothetical protein
MTTYEFVLDLVKTIIWPVASIAIVWLVRRGVVSFLTRQGDGRVEITAPILRGSLGWSNKESRSNDPD